MSAPATAATLPSEPYRGTEPPRLTAHDRCPTPASCTLANICFLAAECSATRARREPRPTIAPRQD